EHSMHTQQKKAKRWRRRGVLYNCYNHIVLWKGHARIASTAPGLLKRRSAWQQASPPQMNQERVAAVALPRHSGNTLFYSFLGREEEKTFEKPCLSHFSFLLLSLQIMNRYGKLLSYL